MSILKSFACAIAIACAVPAANASVLTFNDLAGTAMPGYTALYSYTGFYNAATTVDGFSFRNNSGGYDYVIGPDFTGNSAASYQPYNGNDYFMGWRSYTMTAANQAAFSVSSLDLASWDSAPFSVTITGTRTDGSTITRTVDSSIINYSSTNDFQNIVLSGFTNLASLQFSTGGYSYIALDNIAVNDVPEPASLAIVGLGLAALAGLRRRKG
jgi:hypothetical protein